MPNLGPTELIIILVIALLILGPKRLPAAGRSLGRGVQEFKTGLTTRAEAPAETDASQVAPDARRESSVAAPDGPRGR